MPNHNAGIQSGESLRPSLGLYRDHIMRKILLLSAAALFSHAALAAGPTDPVQKVMDITVKNWSGDAENWKYIFDEDMLTLSLIHI